MIQERSILKVVPPISEEQSSRVEWRGSRLSAMKTWLDYPVSEIHGIARACNRSLYSRTVAGLTKYTNR